MLDLYETILEISLSSLRKNFIYLKNKLANKTKIIAVVKAYAYGHGDIIIAKKVEEFGVNYLWVADFEEGARLRESGIKIPIIIANPGKKSTSKIIEHKLDIVIYSFDLLEIYGKLESDINIHIKFNTGMNRYGFHPNEIDLLLAKLKKYPRLKINSVCSHLASSDNPEKDNLTNLQFKIFEETCETLFEGIGHSVDRHILNTNGVLRFVNKEYEMVRIGIGLYGVSSDKNLQPISTFKSTITQVRIIKKGSYIGYDASFLAKKEIKIGIIPLGYADGLNRKLNSKNGVVIVQNIRCPIIGKISMDSCIVDLTNTRAKSGEKVIIFGKGNSVLSIAKKLETIPYEIYATLNRRIRRVYSD